MAAEKGLTNLTMNFDAERQPGSAFFDEDFVTSEGGAQENQDCVGSLTVEGKRCWVVADGVGGQSGGRIASHLAVDAVLEQFKANPRVDPSSIKSYIERAHTEIVSRQKVDPGVAGMKSTLAVLVSDGSTAVWGHVGDSRIYHFRDGKVIFQTQDHSYSQAKVNMGQMSLADIRQDTDRSVLLDAAGKEGFRGPTLCRRPGEDPVRLLQGDSFLLCVDGFWGLVHETEMEIDLAKGGEAHQWLRFMRQRVDKRLNPDSDNYTAYAIQIVTSGLAVPSVVKAPMIFPPAQLAPPPVSQAPVSQAPVSQAPVSQAPASPSFRQRKAPINEWTVTETAVRAMWGRPVANINSVRSQRFVYALIAISLIVLAALLSAVFLSRRPSRDLSRRQPRDVQSSVPATVQGADSCKPATKSVVDQNKVGMTMVFQRGEAGEFDGVTTGRPLTLTTSTSLGKLVQVEQLSDDFVTINSKKLEIERGGQRQIFILQGAETFSRKDQDCIMSAGKPHRTGPNR